MRIGSGSIERTGRMQLSETACQRRYIMLYYITQNFTLCCIMSYDIYIMLYYIF